MILNELDVYRAALKKIDLMECALPTHNGMILTENADVFNKIQKILACNKMECAHRYLYDLDVENLSDREISKVCSLYQLGVDRGIFPPDEEQCADDAVEDVEPEVVEPAPAPAPVQQPACPTAAYTAVYSAMRDGALKTGEAYSNAINTRSAKADVIAKLEKAGYQHIAILAIEAGDPDMAGCSSPVQIDTDDESFVSEADDEADENKDDNSSDDADKNKDDDSSDDASDKDSDAEDDSSDEDKKEEDVEEPDEKLKDDADDEADDEADDDKDDDKLSDAEKQQLKDSYKKAFKAAMSKCKYCGKCFNDLTLNEKVKFFETINGAWGSKADPVKFMTSKELETLEKVVVKQ